VARDAKANVVDGYEGMKALESKIPAPPRKRSGEAGARIVALYEAWGKGALADQRRCRLKPPATNAATGQ
jgi:hypothetical protein